MAVNVERRRESLDRPLIVLRQKQQAGDPKAAHKSSIIVATTGRDAMRLATKAGKATPIVVRRPSPLKVTPVVVCHQEWSGRSPFREVLAHGSARLAIKRGQ